MADEQKDADGGRTASDIIKRATANVPKNKQTFGGGIETKEDYTELAALQIPEAETLAKNGELTRAIELLLSLEKKCRLGLDIANLKLTVKTMARLCRECEDWERLNTTLLVIAKRHQQNQHAIVEVIAQAREWLDQTPSKEAKVALLTTLREMTDGKIFVEGERAALTEQLAAIKEADGDIDGACDIMLDVYVETFGVLSKRQKIDFILQQIRLTLLKSDMVRAFIVAKKIARSTLELDDMQDLKLRFYRLMIEYHTREKDAFELAQCFHHIYQTPCVLEDDSPESGWRDQLKSCVTFLVLAAHSPMQSDMLHRVASDDKLKTDPVLAPWLATITAFTTPEIIAFPLLHQQSLEEQLRKVGTEELFPHWRQCSHTRTTQHNLRVASKYYKRIRLARLAQLLGLTTDEVEEQLSTLVTEGDVFAKIDRPAGVINFTKPVTAEETLSAWASDIGSLLSEVERTCHLINKENMIHKV